MFCFVGLLHRWPQAGVWHAPSSPTTAKAKKKKNILKEVNYRLCSGYFFVASSVIFTPGVLSELFGQLLPYCSSYLSSYGYERDSPSGGLETCSVRVCV